MDDKEFDKLIKLTGAPAPIAQSRELSNPKRYTVKELLGSEEAMKDLLHERLLAVRDDLNFAINQCNPNINLQNFTRQIQALRGEMEALLRSQEIFQSQMVAKVASIEKAMQRQPKWWTRAWKKLKAR